MTNPEPRPLPEGFPRLDKTEGRRITYCVTTDLPKRSCQCKSCVSGRNHRKGHRKQDDVRRFFEALTGTEALYKGRKGNEEAWTHLPVRIEVKAGQQVGPVATAYTRQEAQSDQSKPFGDPREFVGCSAPEGMSDFLITVRASKFVDVIYALGFVKKDEAA